MKKPSVPALVMDPKEMEQRVHEVIEVFHRAAFSDVLWILAIVVRAVLTKNPNPQKAREAYKNLLIIAKTFAPNVPFNVIDRNEEEKKEDSHDPKDCADCVALPICQSLNALAAKHTNKVVH